MPYFFLKQNFKYHFWQYKSFIGILKINVLKRAYKKIQLGQHAEIYLAAIKAQDKAKMELPLDVVSKHAFLYLWMPD